MVLTDVDYSLCGGSAVARCIRRCVCDHWCVRAAAQDIVPVVRMRDTLNSSVIKANRPHGQVRIT